MAIEEIRLIDAAEIAVEVGDPGTVGAFEVEDHGGAGPFADEPVEQKMVGFRGPAGGSGG